jgi:hypothetical protein
MVAEALGAECKTRANATGILGTILLPACKSDYKDKFTDGD